MKAKFSSGSAWTDEEGADLKEAFTTTVDFLNYDMKRMRDSGAGAGIFDNVNTYETNRVRLDSLRQGAKRYDPKYN